MKLYRSSFELKSIRPDELCGRMLLSMNCAFSAPGSPFSSPLRVHIFRSVQPCKVRSFSITYFFLSTPILYVLVLIIYFCYTSTAMLFLLVVYLTGVWHHELILGGERTSKHFFGLIDSNRR